MANRIFMLMFSFLLYTGAFAQKPDKEIESSIETLNKAMISPDKSVLEKLTAEDLSYGHSTGVVQNKSELYKRCLIRTGEIFSDREYKSDCNRYR